MFHFTSQRTWGGARPTPLIYKKVGTRGVDATRFNCTAGLTQSGSGCRVRSFTLPGISLKIRRQSC